MFRNYLAAALNNLSRNRLYAAISILGLAVGMAAAILTGLYIKDELTFDRFIPGYRNVYVVVSELHTSGRAPLIADLSPPQIGQWMKLDFPEVKAASRLIKQDLGVRRGDIETIENIGWVDPDFFTILPLPVLAGDPVATMHRPDGLVLTRAMARKYFGQDAPIGQVLELNHAITLRVGAVLQDLPANSHLTQGLFVSGLSSGAPMRGYETHPIPRGGFGVAGRTYVLLPNAAAAERLNAAMPAFFLRHIALPNGKLLGDFSASLKLVPLSALHLYPLGGTALVDSTAQGSPATLVALGLVAVLILVVAGINFVNLMTARAGRRAVEVGVRKAVGAERGDLVLQFIGEAVIYALIGLVLALSVAELALPAMRILLDRPLDFAFWREPALLAAAIGMSLAVGVLAGIYPALVQSSFRPALV